MGTKFSEFLDETEAEAKAEGPEAEAELHYFDVRSRLINQLIARRRELGLTQARLASESGIGQAEISRIESGRSNLTLETLSALVGALHCRLTLQPDS